MDLRPARGRWIGATAFAAFCAFCLYLSSDFSATWDESVHLDRADHFLGLWRLLLSGQALPPPEVWTHYGELFNLIAHPFVMLAADAPYSKSPGAYEAKHVVTFLFSLLAYLGLARIYRRLPQARFPGLLALAALATCPVFFAHSFFNPKDAPLAAFFTFGSAALGLRAGRLTRLMEKGDAKAWRREGALAGLLAGLCAGIRPGGLFLLAGWSLLVAARWLAMPRPVRRGALRGAALGLLSAGLATLLIMAFFYPHLWLMPGTWLSKTAGYYQRASDWPGCRLMLGHCYSAANYPGYYLPLQLFVTLPLPHLVAGLVGLASFWQERRTLHAGVRGAGLMLMLQATLLPAWLMLTRVPLYDGARHVLFIFPAWCFFAGYGWLALARMCRTRRRRAFGIAATALLLGFVIHDMIRLHPYEYSYYNETLRAEPLDGRWETDYWGLSVRELAGWLDAHGDPGIPVYAEPGHLFNLYAKGPFVIVKDFGYKETQRRERTRPFYLGYYAHAHTYTQPLPGCRRIYAVTRRLGVQNLTMGDLYRCD